MVKSMNWEFRKSNSDQQAVWEEVQASMRSSQTSSETMALSDAYAQRESELQNFRKTLQLPSDAVGLAAFSDGKFQGLDLFDRHSTLQYFWESLLDSYALELIASDRETQIAADPAEEKIVQEVLDKAAGAEWEGFDSPGEGRDWRLGNNELSGSALVWEDNVMVHLQLFPCNPDFASQRSEQTAAGRPRIRRRYLNRPAGGDGPLFNPVVE